MSPKKKSEEILKPSTKRPLEDAVDELADQIARDSIALPPDEQIDALKALTAYMVAKNKIAPEEPSKPQENSFAQSLKDGIRNGASPERGSEGDGPGQF